MHDRKGGKEEHNCLGKFEFKFAPTKKIDVKKHITLCGGVTNHNVRCEVFDCASPIIKFAFKHSAL